MQTTIVFAPFCEAFIGGVSFAHGEIFYRKKCDLGGFSKKNS